MKSLLVGLGVVSVLCVSGCKSSSPYGDAYNYNTRNYYGTSKAGTVTPAKTSSTVSSTAPKTVVMPATVAPVGTVASTTSAKPVNPGVIQIPATPASITNVVSVTNTVDVSRQTDVEVVNGQQRRAHLMFKGKDTEEGFLKLVARKQSVLEDVRVIGKLYQEKDNQQKRFTLELQNQFGMKADRNYQYDADAMTINEIVKPATGTEGAKVKLHVKLKDAAAAQGFARLVAAKRISVEQMASLQLMNREKQMEVAEYDRQMADAYAIVKDRNYQYDAATRTLYELVKLPSGMEMPKAGGAVVPVK